MSIDKLKERECFLFHLYNAWEDGGGRHRLVDDRGRYGVQDIGGPVRGAHRGETELLNGDVDAMGAPDLELRNGEAESLQPQFHASELKPQLTHSPNAPQSPKFPIEKFSQCGVFLVQSLQSFVFRFGCTAITIVPTIGENGRECK